MPTSRDMPMRALRRALVTSAAAIAALGIAGPARAESIGDTSLFSTFAGNATGITSGPDGNLWFTAHDNDDIGRITTSGAVTIYSLAPASGPTAITTGPDGNLWFTESTSNDVGSITTTGIVTEFAVPTPTAGLGGITTGPDGSLWFTEHGADQIGRITTSGVITEFALPSGALPERITAGSDGNLWFTELGNRIGRITTSGTVTEYSIPTANAFPEGIAAGSDGNLWFAENGADQIGRITTDGTITEFPVPSGTAPNKIAAGPDGSLWFTEYGTANIGRITTWGAVTEWATPYATTLDLAAGPDGALWYGNTMSAEIGRIFAGTPTASLSASSADFGTIVPGDTAERTVTVSNTGDGDLALTGLAVIGTDAGDVSLGGATTCAEGTLLAPGATCDVVLDLTPTTTGTKTATLRISTASGAPQTAALTAEARNPPPAAATGAAISVTAEGGILGGIATPSGEDTHASFEYGETTAYGEHTATEDLGAGTAPVVVHAALTGLRPATTYHFRLAAASTSGTTYGADGTFTTAGAPVPPVTTTPASPAAPAPAAAPLTPPALTGRPAAISPARTARIAFAGPAGATQCRLDGGPWIPCASPYTVTGLGAGEHVLAVRTVDAAGAPVGAAALARFQTNANAPAVTLRTAAPLRPSATGVVTLRLLCSPREGGGRGACAGTATLRLGHAGLGHATFRARAGGTATVRIKLSHNALSRLPRGKAVRVTIAIDVKDLAGNRGRTAIARTLRRG